MSITPYNRNETLREVAEAMLFFTAAYPIQADKITAPIIRIWQDYLADSLASDIKICAKIWIRRHPDWFPTLPQFAALVEEEASRRNPTFLSDVKTISVDFGAEKAAIPDFRLIRERAFRAPKD